MTPVAARTKQKRRTADAAACDGATFSGSGFIIPRLEAFLTRPAYSITNRRRASNEWMLTLSANERPPRWIRLLRRSFIHCSSLSAMISLAPAGMAGCSAGDKPPRLPGRVPGKPGGSRQLGQESLHECEHGALSERRASAETCAAPGRPACMSPVNAYYNTK